MAETTTTDERPEAATIDAVARPRDSRTRYARASEVELALTAVAVAVYAAATGTGPHRVAIIATCAAMLGKGAVLWMVAGRPGIASQARRWVPASIAVHLVACTLLVVLDGGVASPIGPVMYCALPFLAIRYPRRAYRAFALVAVGCYGVAAVIGEPAPPGHPFVHTALFLAMSHQCARHAAALAELDRRLRDLGRVDPMTGCLNRRGFDERVAQELSRAARTGLPASIVLVDLDDFKAVNDRHGHLAGDELLRATARALTDVGRAGDAVGRLGGDEFALVLPGCGPDAAQVVIARIRQELGSWSPASMGAASTPADGCSGEELHQAADGRLYADKAVRRPVGAASRPARRSPAPPRPADAPRPTTPAERSLRGHRRILGMTGSVGVTDFAIAVTFVVLFLGGDPRRTRMLAVSGAGALIGAAMIVAARNVRHRNVATGLTVAGATAMFALATALVVVHGGVGSPTALGMLAPLPLIALAMPARPAAAALAGAAGTYVAVAVLVGAPSPAHVCTYLTGLAAIAAMCRMQRSRADRKRALLLRMSRIDALTGCLNRRGFEERTEAELAQARRTGAPLSIVMLDLDDFKRVNDRAGHAAGDELLRWVGTTLGEVFRGHDLVGRLGGDEFAVLLPGCSAADASGIALRTQTSLAERTSVSVGTATLGAGDGDDAEGLHRAADAALYLDKRRATRRTVPPRHQESTSPVC